MTDQYSQYPSYPGEGGATPTPHPQASSGASNAQVNYQPGAVIPYASWWARVGATLLDGLLTFVVAVVPLVLGLVLAFRGAEAETVVDPATGMETFNVIGGVNPLGVVIAVLGVLMAVAFGLWNQAYRQGTKGQSLGKQALGIKVVRVEDGDVLGTGAGFLRWLMNTILGNLCFINYLWPLWDEKKQTWHDKVVGSVVIQKP